MIGTGSYHVSDNPTALIVHLDACLSLALIEMRRAVELTTRQIVFPLSITYSLETL